MDSFDFQDQKPKRSQVALPQLGMWDILSILVLLLTCCLVGYFGLVFANPLTPLNPLRPYYLLTPSATPTRLPLPATWTPTPTIYFSPTATLRPSITPPPTFTPPLLTPPTNTPTSTETPSLTPTPKAPFSAVAVNALASTIYYPDAGCNWFGVAVTIDDQNNSPLVGQQVKLMGTLQGKTLDKVLLSGVSTQYGQSGAEFFLGTTPIASNKTLFVQVFDQSGLVPLSEKVYFSTYTDCDKNLILIRFKKNR